VLLITPMAVGSVSLLAKFCLLLYPFGMSFATSELWFEHLPAHHRLSNDQMTRSDLPSSLAVFVIKRTL